MCFFLNTYRGNVEIHNCRSNIYLTRFFKRGTKSEFTFWARGKKPKATRNYRLWENGKIVFCGHFSSCYFHFRFRFDHITAPNGRDVLDRRESLSEQFRKNSEQFLLFYFRNRTQINASSYLDYPWYTLRRKDKIVLEIVLKIYKKKIMISIQMWKKTCLYLLGHCPTFSISHFLERMVWIGIAK